MGIVNPGYSKRISNLGKVEVNEGAPGLQLVFGNAAASPPAHEVEGEPGIVGHLFVTNSDKEVYFIGGGGGGGGRSFACAVTAIFLLTAATVAATVTPRPPPIEMPFPAIQWSQVLDSPKVIGLGGGTN